MNIRFSNRSLVGWIWFRSDRTDGHLCKHEATATSDFSIDGRVRPRQKESENPVGLSIRHVGEENDNPALSK